jgi:hypothetical protein
MLGSQLYGIEKDRPGEILGDMEEPSGTRVGDAERDKATEYLREHMAAGRLDAAEFDERLTRALSAKFTSDLDALFTDLPEPKPNSPALPEPFQAPPWQSEPASGGQQLAERPPAAVPATGINKAYAVISAVAWPAAIVLCFATGWRFWWIMIIPIFLSMGIRRSQQ